MRQILLEENLFEISALNDFEGYDSYMTRHKMENRRRSSISIFLTNSFALKAEK